jgi:MPBQ/MSBQ methyltransferase
VTMRFIQHKAEARWFYRVVSIGYDRWINPLFWTAPMRDEALALARLDSPDLEVVDVGAGTGFATEAIVQAVAPDRVTMLDQSPHQLARAERKPQLACVTKILGDAEALPFATDSRDRYVSTGSIEYWPDPQRAIAEAYRVLRPGGVALLAGPLRRTHPLARALSDAWMLFPAEDEYVAWFERAGFTSIERVHVAPEWWDPAWDRYAVAVAAVKPRAGDPPPLPPAAPREGGPGAPAGEEGRVTPARLVRFALGSLAGAAFIPVALWFRATRARAGRRRPRSATRP